MTADPPLILVTGAMGRLGRATVSSFLRHGYRVRGLDLPSRANRRAARRMDPRLEMLWGDIRDEALLIRATRDVNAVMHHAAMLPPASETCPELAEAVNVGGTRRLLNVLAAHAPDAFFLYPSSVTVYGADLDRTPPVHLDSPLAPSDHYTRHKLSCEAMVTNSPLAWSIHRLGVVLHPDDRDTRPDTLKMLFNTSLDSRMEYLHPNDAARAQRTTAQGWRQTMLRPAPGRFSGRFGSQRIYRGQPGAYHGGLDMASPSGTPFVAPADGVVVLAAETPFTLEGRLLMLDHGMGLGSAFLHCSTHLVRVGERVARGQPIGTVGMTGRATGPHLHWAWGWQVGTQLRRLDPLLFLA